MCFQYKVNDTIYELLLVLLFIMQTLQTTASLLNGAIGDIFCHGKTSMSSENKVENKQSNKM